MIRLHKVGAFASATRYDDGKPYSLRETGPQTVNARLRGWPDAAEVGRICLAPRAVG